MEALVKIEELDLFKEEVAKIRKLSEGIVVSSIDDTVPMELAKTLLKQTKMALGKIEAKRKELKEDSLRTGQRIDEVARKMREDLGAIAADLQKKIDYEKLFHQQQLDKLFVARKGMIEMQQIGVEYTLGKEFTKDHGFMQLSDQEFQEFIEDSVNKKTAEARRRDAITHRILVAGELHDYMTVDIAQCTDEEFSNDLKAAHERKLQADKEKKASERARKILMYSDGLPDDKSFINDLSEEDFVIEIHKAMSIIAVFNNFREGVRVVFGNDSGVYPVEYFRKAYDFHKEFGDGKDLIKNFQLQLILKEKIKNRIEQAKAITGDFGFYEMPLQSMPESDEEFTKWITGLQRRVGSQANRRYELSKICGNDKSILNSRLWKMSPIEFDKELEEEKQIVNTLRTEKRIKQVNDLKEVVCIETSIENLRTMTDEQWDFFIQERVIEKQNMDGAGQYEKAVDYFKRLREVDIPEFTHPGLVANIKKLIGKIETYVYEKTKV